MDPIRKIVVAVDFSENSLRAERTAGQLAKALDAELHVVHAFDLRTPMLSPYEIAIPDSYITLSRQAAEQRLAEVVDRLAKMDVQAQPHLPDAPGAPAIAQAAERIGADLIVMGTRGLTGLKHVVLGSVAERTLRLAPCSVLTVK
jgi:nucleotide-binding universal stress UspA family protein